jgi:hypothetical protein
MHDTMDNEPEDDMNKPMATLGAAAAGALAMYYLDPELGARRRAVLADLVRSGLPGDASPARGRYGRRASLRPSPANPRSDAELRDRIQSALDRMVSHPRALHVNVDHGVVRLSGRLLAQERDGVLEQVQRMPGVHKLVNATTAHAHPQEIARGARPVPVPATSR